MDSVRKIMKSMTFKVLLIQGILIIILNLIGFRITYDASLEASWDAIGAMGEWAGAIVGLLIPIAVVYIEHSILSNREEIGKSNTDLYDEFQNFKDEYLKKINVLADLIDNEGNIRIDGGSWDTQQDDESINDEKMKNKALKFVNIAMVTNTQRVADHLNVEIEKAFEILRELLLHDGLISAAGQITLEDVTSIIWMKKKN